MIHLLDNYTFSPALRYDAHRLIYTYSEKEEPIQIVGFPGAALLFVRLINSDEGEEAEEIIRRYWEWLSNTAQ